MNGLVSGLKMVLGIYEPVPKIIPMRIKTGIKGANLLFYFELDKNGDYKLRNPDWKYYTITCRDFPYAYFSTPKNLINTLKLIENSLGERNVR